MRLFVAVVLLVLCSSALGGVARPKPASQGGPDDALLKEIAAARENAKTFAKELPALQDFAKRVRSLKLADVVSVRVELDSEPDANKKKGANGANKKNGANGANKKNGATKKSNPFIVVIAFAKEYAKDTKLDVISKDMVALKDKISKEVSKIDDLPFVVEIRQSTKNVPLSSAMLERAELVRRGRIQSLAQAGRGRQQARSQVKTRAPPAFIAGSLWLRSCPETRNAPGAGSAGGILIDGANNYYLMSNFHVIDYNLCYNMAPTRAKEAPTVFGPGDANHAPRGTQLADMLDVTGKTGAGTNNRAATRNPYVHILDNSHDYGNLQDDGGFDVAVAKIAAGSQVSCQHKVFSNLGVISRATIAGTHASNRVNDIFMRVVKFGMRTGWTEGIIASEEGQNVHVRGYWPTFPRNGGAGESADMSNKKPADFKCTDDACASIVDSADQDDARLKGWNSAVFAGPGDSGSWVFDDNHNAYGILHSIRWELVSGIWVSYTNVYPMTDVLAALNSRHNRNYQVCTDNRANFAA